MITQIGTNIATNDFQKLLSMVVFDKNYSCVCLYHIVSWKYSIFQPPVASEQ